MDATCPTVRPRGRDGQRRRERSEEPNEASYVTRRSAYPGDRKPSNRITRMPHKFTLNPESLKRRFSVYVVIAKGPHDTKLYAGKTGDNREGCNPIISRCGNHFSYHKIHSQVRNKIGDHEDREYTYVFDHFDDYTDDTAKTSGAIR